MSRKSSNSSRSHHPPPLPQNTPPTIPPPPQDSPTIQFSQNWLGLNQIPNFENTEFDPTPLPSSSYQPPSFNITQYETELNPNPPYVQPPSQIQFQVQNSQQAQLPQEDDDETQDPYIVYRQYESEHINPEEEEEANEEEDDEEETEEVQPHHPPIQIPQPRQQEQRPRKKRKARSHV